MMEARAQSRLNRTSVGLKHDWAMRMISWATLPQSNQRGIETDFDAQTRLQ